MHTSNILGNDPILYPDPMPMNTCVFCGKEFADINFKGRCVCEDCIAYVKELM